MKIFKKKYVPLLALSGLIPGLPSSMAQSEDFREASNVISFPTTEGYFCGRPIVEFGSVVHHVQQPDIVTFGSDGDDVIIGTANDDRIFGRQGDDCIFGLDGDDELRGFQGSDVIFGGNGNDELFGNQGDDILRGQAGFDTYEGGQGEIDVCENLDGDTSFSRCEIIEEREHPVVIAAGDLACRVDDPLFADGYGTGRVCVHGFVAGLAETLTPTAFLALGDFQSGAADPSNWQLSYDKSWGRLYNVTYPTRGDGEAYTAEQQAYADYFNSRFNELRPIATNIDEEIDRGSYSVQIGDWHIVSIDTQVNTEWLSSDLAAATSDCKLAAMHMPATSSGQNFDGDAFLRDGVGNPWNVLNEYKVAAVLSGDDHHYERFKPQTVIRAYELQEDGETWEAIAAEQGAVQFVVGTGGQNVRGIPYEHPNTAIDKNGDRTASNEFLGFLELTLKPGQADYRFIGYTPWPKSDADRVPISQYTTDYQGYQIHTPVAYEVRDEGTLDCNTAQNTPWRWLINGRDPIRNFRVGDIYSLNVGGWDDEADEVTFRAYGLPPGLSLSGDRISGTLSEAGVYNIDVIAIDAGSGKPSPFPGPITVNVQPNPDWVEPNPDCLNDGRDEGTHDCNTAQNTPWIWTNNGRDPIRDLRVGEVYSLDLSGLGWDEEADEVTFRAYGLPPGLSLSGGTISGTPSEGGEYTIDLIAIDAGSGIPSPYQITIQVDPNSECLNNGRENDDGCLNDGRLNDGRTQ